MYVETVLDLATGALSLSHSWPPFGSEAGWLRARVCLHACDGYVAW